MTVQDINKLAAYLDSTNLQPDASHHDIEKLCEEAVHHNMAAVCVHPYRVALCQSLVSCSSVKVCTVIGFPLGANMLATKLSEARQAISDGADELDMVINLAAVKDHDFHLAEQEVRSLASLKIDHSMLLKVIVETARLTTSELRDLSRWLGDWGADFIKTSTGFAERGVSLEDIETIQSTRNPHLKIKASGGVRTLAFAQQLIAAGADRIGTSQAVNILREMEAQRQ